jgi:hypothetical protein
VGDRAISQALRRRYRGREGRSVRNRSRELRRAGDRNVSELGGPQRAPQQRASVAYKFTGAETGASELWDGYFAARARIPVGGGISGVP